MNEANNDSNTVIRLFKDEFEETIWITYCGILWLEEEVAKKLVSVELTVSKVLPQIN